MTSPVADRTNSGTTTKFPAEFKSVVTFKQGAKELGDGASHLNCHRCYAVVILHVCPFRVQSLSDSIVSQLASKRVKKNQLDVQLILSNFRQPLHVSDVSRPIIRRYNRMYTTIGTYYSF
jgi:hypothetical protein